MPGDEKPGGDLGLDVEAFGRQLEAPRHVAPHDLVAGLHVGQRGAVDDVRQRGQRAVGDDGEPWSRGTPRQKPGAVNDRGRASEYRIDQEGQLRRIELEVGVLNRHDGAAGVSEAEPDRVPLPAVAFDMDDGQKRGAGQSVEHFTRAVARPVIDDDDLARRREVDREEPIEDPRHRRRLIEDGDDDRNESRRGAAWIGQSWAPLGCACHSTANA